MLSYLSTGTLFYYTELVLVPSDLARQELTFATILLGWDLSKRHAEGGYGFQAAWGLVNRGGVVEEK